MEFSPCPYFDLQKKFELQQTTAVLIKNKLVQSAHDVSEGGLWVTIMESCFNRALGCNVTMQDGFRKDAFWFGEAQSRVVVSVSPALEKEFKTAMQKTTVAFSLLGNVIGENIIIAGENWGSVNEWKLKYDTAIEKELS